MIYVLMLCYHIAYAGPIRRKPLVQQTFSSRQAYYAYYLRRRFFAPYAPKHPLEGSFAHLHDDGTATCNLHPKMRLGDRLRTAFIGAIRSAAR